MVESLTNSTGPMSGSIHTKATRRRVTDGGRTLDVDDVDVHALGLVTSTSSSDVFSRKSSGSPGTTPLQEAAMWLEDGEGGWIFNGRSHCDIFVSVSEEGETPSKSSKMYGEGEFKELRGPLTNTVQAEAVLMKDGDDDFEDNPGKQLGQRTYITLLIGDWEGALKSLADVTTLDPEGLASFLEYKVVA